MKFDFNVILYISLVILLALFALSLKFKSTAIIKGALKIAFAGICIYLFNLFIGKAINFTIPLNPVTAAVTGLLGIPGIFLVIIIMYAIYP